MRAFRGGIVAAILFLPLFALAYKSPGQPNGFVNDFAKILTANQVLELNKDLAAFSLQGEQNEISVVTVPTLGGDDVESYSANLFKEWGIGKAEKDNGVLLLIAVEDRKMRIEVGYGAEALLTDAQSGAIVRNILTPAFRSGDFYGGINKAVQEIARALSGDASSAVPEESPRFAFSLENILGFGVFVAVFLASILGASKSWWLGGVLGAIVGGVITFFVGFFYFGLISIAVLVPLGLLFDFLVSRSYQKSMLATGLPPVWLGGGRGGSGGSGGFGGFGGGGSGGGGSSGSW